MWFVALLVAVSIGLLVGLKPAHAKTFTVVLSGDAGDANPGNGSCSSSANISGLCTLRAAIEEANALSGPDTINFNIPQSGGGVRTISPKVDLPRITGAVTIDGYTQPGAQENTLARGTNANLMIELDGSAATDFGADGLIVAGGNTTIRGLVINRFQRSSTPGLSNGGFGIFLANVSGNTNNVIEGNFIGTDHTGTTDLGNDRDGIVDFSARNRIGGTAPEARNLISGNGGNGVVVASDFNTIQGNLIGTDKSGTNDLGNDLPGLSISGDGFQNTIAANTIAFNDLVAGVAIRSGTANRILDNSIFSNAGPGIDLGVDGSTANDAGDTDTGANELQNKPVLTAAVTSGGSTTIRGTLNSTPKSTFTIQFFSNPPGENEGRMFIGQKSVTTDSNGNTGTFSFTLAKALSSRQRVTATATRVTGDTSEFSAPKDVSVV